MRERICGKECARVRCAPGPMVCARIGAPLSLLAGFVCLVCSCRTALCADATQVLKAAHSHLPGRALGLRLTHLVGERARSGDASRCWYHTGI